MPARATLSVLAEGSAVTSSNLDTRGGGLIKITTGSTALAESKPTVTTTIGGSGSTIITSGNLDVQATGITDADASATTVSGGFVNVAVFSSTARTQPNVNVVVAASSHLGSGGTITIGASHNPVTQPLSDGSFTAPGAVDTSNGATGNTISFTLPHGLQTGDVVTYNAQIVNPATDFVINGLTDGRQYGVIVVDNDTLQFGVVFSGAQVDTLRDEIRFGSFVPNPPGADGVSPARRRSSPSPHNLETGDAVYYFAPSGGTAVGGLVSGKRYIVFVVDAFTLKLLDPVTMSTNPVESVSVVRATCPTTPARTSARSTRRIPSRTAIAVTYHAPPTRSFGSAAVGLSVDGSGQPRRNADNTPIYANDGTIFLGSNPDSNGVFQTGHGYSTGDQITYTVTGGTAASRHNVFGVQVADGATATYWVIRIDEFRIKLADSKCHATGQGCDCTTTTVNGAGQALADRSPPTHSSSRRPGASLRLGPSPSPASAGPATTPRRRRPRSPASPAASARRPTARSSPGRTREPGRADAQPRRQPTDGRKVVHTINRAKDAALTTDAVGTKLVDGQVYFVVNRTAVELPAREHDRRHRDRRPRQRRDRRRPARVRDRGREPHIVRLGRPEPHRRPHLAGRRQAASRRRRRGRNARRRAVGRRDRNGFGLRLGRRRRRRQDGDVNCLGHAEVVEHDRRQRTDQRAEHRHPDRQSRQGRRDLVERRRRPRLDRQANATATLTATTTLTIAASAMLSATNNLTVDASATVNANSVAGTHSAGLGAGVHADATSPCNYTTTTTVAGTLTAGGKLTVKSRTNITGNAAGSAQGGGLGVDADSAGTVNIGTGEADSTMPSRGRPSGLGAAQRRQGRDRRDRRRALRPQRFEHGGRRLRRRLRRDRHRQRGRDRRSPARDQERGARATSSSATRPSGSRRCTTTSTSRRAPTPPATASRATRRRDPTSSTTPPRRSPAATSRSSRPPT